MIILFLFLFFDVALARDLVEISRHSFFNESKIETRVRTGAPPVQLSENIRMINSLSYSENQQDELTLEPNRDQTLKLKELTWSPLFFFKGYKDWRVSWGFLTAFRSEGQQLQFNSKTFSIAQFINWSPEGRKLTGWNWSWGIFIPDRSLQYPVFPGISFSYLSEDQKWNWQFRGPSISKTYTFNDSHQWISKFYFSSGSFRVDRDGFLSQRGSYVQTRQTRIETGLKTMKAKPWVLSFLVGYQLRGNIQVVNSQDQDPDNISERAAAYFDLAVSYALF